MNRAQASNSFRPHAPGLHQYIKRTPLELSHDLSERSGARVWLKLENLQHTGSFKARGALNKLLSLADEQKSQPIITASTGNHGAAVAFGCRTLGLRAIVFVPENASPVKVAAIKRHGAEVRAHGYGIDTEMHARRHAEANGLVYISPYNDADVIAGQGSIAAELEEQLPELDAVFASVGGGGLIAGIVARLKARMKRLIEALGCLPENSPELALAARSGEFVAPFNQPTLSDGTAGGFEPNALTFDLCRALVDEFVLVSEAEISAAMRDFIEREHLLIEGAAGVAVAGFLKVRERFVGRNVVIVICGANISLETLKRIL